MWRTRLSCPAIVQLASYFELRQLAHFIGGHAKYYTVAGFGELALGTATSLPPKPSTPPVLMWMAVTLLSRVVTLCTAPNLVPSEEVTARPTRELSAAGADADLSPGELRAGFSVGSAGLVAGCGIGAVGWVAEGDVLGGAGVCVWATAESSGMPASSHCPQQANSLEHSHVSILFPLVPQTTELHRLRSSSLCAVYF